MTPKRVARGKAVKGREVRGRVARHKLIGLASPSLSTLTSMRFMP